MRPPLFWSRRSQHGPGYCSRGLASQTKSRSVATGAPADHHVVDPAGFRAALRRRWRPRVRETHDLRCVPTGPKRVMAMCAAVRLCQRAFTSWPNSSKSRIRLPQSNTLRPDTILEQRMFLFRGDRYLAELASHQPEMLSACEAAMDKAEHDLDFIRPDAEAFLTSPSDSIDYAVMEHTSEGGVVKLDCGWSDVGAWPALWEIGAGDANGNVTEGDVLLQNARNSYVRSENRLVAAIGVDNLVVVETADAVMVGATEHMQDIKRWSRGCPTLTGSEATVHQRVYRPWGSYESLVVGEQFQVKRLTVTPGQTLSLQLHHHRAEHWVVVSGQADIIRGESN
ncbi:MAG: hypothetical protein CM15mP74_17970 [Halieaceae bacterium]|nr:MAG: hypothetical protein CM15mP74_17970 [Halieaceae bacterium]